MQENIERLEKTDEKVGDERDLGRYKELWSDVVDPPFGPLRTGVVGKRGAHRTRELGESFSCW